MNRAVERNYFNYIGGREDEEIGRGWLKQKENVQKRVGVSDYKGYWKTKKFSVCAREQWEIKMQKKKLFDVVLKYQANDRDFIKQAWSCH